MAMKKPTEADQVAHEVGHLVVGAGHRFAGPRVDRDAARVEVCEHRAQPAARSERGLGEGPQRRLQHRDARVGQRPCVHEHRRVRAARAGRDDHRRRPRDADEAVLEGDRALVEAGVGCGGRCGRGAGGERGGDDLGGEGRAQAGGEGGGGEPLGEARGAPVRPTVEGTGLVSAASHVAGRAPAEPDPEVATDATGRRRRPRGTAAGLRDRSARP
ncbi:MAG: hypothetical protein ACK50I_09970 [Burkholderiales bacterium]